MSEKTTDYAGEASLDAPADHVEPFGTELFTHTPTQFGKKLGELGCVQTLETVVDDNPPSPPVPWPYVEGDIATPGPHF